MINYDAIVSCIFCLLFCYYEYCVNCNCLDGLLMASNFSISLSGSFSKDPYGFASLFCLEMGSSVFSIVNFKLRVLDPNVWFNGFNIIRPQMDQDSYVDSAKWKISKILIAIADGPCCAGNLL